MSADLPNTKPKVLVTMTKNAAANLFRSGTMWVIVLFLPPLLVRTLDKPTYGVWLLLLQLATYIAVFDGGVQVAVARYVARAEGLEDRSYLARLLSSVGMLLLLACLATILLAALASWRLTEIFQQIPNSIAQGARQSLFVIGTSLAITLPFSVLAGFFLGVQKNELTAFSTSAGKVLGAIGTAWAAFHHRGLLAMADWVALGNIVQCLLYLFFWQRERQRQPLHLSHGDRTLAREFLFFCSATMVSQFSYILITGMDMPIVAAFDFRSTAYYGVASTLACILIVPHGAMVNTLMPVAAEISVAGDPRQLGNVLLKSTRFSTALLSLIALPFLLLTPLLLRIWVGPDYAAHALLFAQILVIAQFARLTMLPYAIIAFAAGQQQRTLVSPIAEGAINLLCSLVLVRLIGARGVALGTLIGAFAGVSLHFAVSVPRTDCIQVSRRKLLGAGILQPLGYALPILLAMMLGIRHIASPLLQVPTAIAADVALLALFWKFSFDAAEREHIRGLLGHLARFRARLLPEARA